MLRYISTSLGAHLHCTVVMTESKGWFMSILTNELESGHEGDMCCSLLFPVSVVKVVANINSSSDHFKKHDTLRFLVV